MESVAPAAMAVAESQQQTPLVSREAGNSLGADFTQVLDGFRQRADAVSETVAKATQGDGMSSRGQEQIRQLVDLYTYAVDTQLLVRTSSQMTTGLRQLMSGQ